MFGWGIGILVAITVGMILLRMFFKTAFKIVSIIWFVMFLAGLAFGILIYVDVGNMKESCPENSPVFLAEDEGTILTGMKLTLEGDQEMTTQDMFITDIDKFQEEYENDFENLLETEYCKIVLIDIDIFQNFSDIELSSDFLIPPKIIVDIIKSDSPVDVLADYQADEEGLSASEKAEFEDQIGDEIGTPVQLKGFLFAALVGTALNQEGPGFMIKNMNNGNIRVKKETLLFKFAKFLPYSMFEDTLNNMIPTEGEQ